MKLRPILLSVALAAGLAAAAPQAGAWGNSGHRMVGVAAIKALPPELPKFVRSDWAAAEVGELSREPDRWKGAGRIHDTDRDSGHFIDLLDDGRALGGAVIDPLPRTRVDFDTAVRAGGSDLIKTGWLPYSLVGMYQQLVKDFGYWRVAGAAEKRAHGKKRAWYKADRKRREALILRDIGELSHYVGDGSQPLHVSIHYNGWGDFPNPNGYTQDKIHAPFESGFVGRNVTLADVQANVRPYEACTAGIEACTVAYLRTSLTYAEPLYALWGQGGFADGDPRGKAFAAERVGAGASKLRDLILDAWRASATAKVGYPELTVADVEAGKDAWKSLTGEE